MQDLKTRIEIRVDEKRSEGCLKKSRNNIGIRTKEEKSEEYLQMRVGIRTNSLSLD